VSSTNSAMASAIRPNTQGNHYDRLRCLLPFPEAPKTLLGKEIRHFLIRRSILIPRCVGGFPLNIKFTLLFADQVIEGPFITLDKLV
jgi:hypothetical protein